MEKIWRMYYIIYILHEKLGDKMKKGLVLEGGGTKGAYQIGAYRALTDLGMQFTGIAGTSIGALNGALIVQGDFDAMEDIWVNYDYKSFMNIDEDTYERYKNLEMKVKSLHDVVELMNKARKNQGIDISPLRKLLEEKIDEEKIRKSKIDFGITTAYWDGKIFPKLLYTEDIPEGRLIDYLIASSSLPIFQLDKLDDKLYLDGMFSDNIPINMLAQKGYDDIVVIRLVDDFLGKMIINRYQDLNLKVIVPSQCLGGSLNKDKDHIESNIKLGYLDTMKAYKRYDGVNYFFNLDCKYNEDYCFNKICNWSKDTINDLCYLLNIKKDINRRTLMENVIPKIIEVLNIDKNSSYKDIFYSIYERKLEENNINRVELYDFNKVIQICNKQMNGDKLLVNHSTSKLAKIITNLIIYDFNKQK
ncbi:patatin-like phospholipase family protein [Terrisporobacter glycolicus]|uniref:patatin-like phospholipase family protein n=1 Tax=Terrisporobacter glycolicus TaxID=36841 RepID=UPI000A5A3C9B